jgi:anti-sigma-K factor RskA
MAAVIVALIVLQSVTLHRLDLSQASNRSIAAVLSAPDARIKTSTTSVGGTVTAVISASDHEAVITTAGMPVPSEARVYQLWVISSSGARSAGLLSASRTPVLAAGINPGDSLGITIEPAGGTTKPTTTPIVVIPSQA